MTGNRKSESESESESHDNQNDGIKTTQDLPAEAASERLDFDEMKCPFNLEMSLHEMFGSGTFADVVLWRRKDHSIALIAIASLVWFLFEKGGYTFLSLVANILMILIVILFLWSNAAAILHRPPPPLPDLEIREETILYLSNHFCSRINNAIKLSRELALGKDSRLFLEVAIVLWFLATVGAWFDMLTMLYLSVLFILIVPVSYEKYKHNINEFVYHALKKIKEYHGKFSRYFLSLIKERTSKSKSW